LRVSQLILFALAASSLFAIDAPGVTNFHQVDEHLYRGAVPSERGLERLQKLGVHIVVDLLPGGERSKKEQQRVEALGMRYINIPMNALKAPSEEQMSQALASTASGPSEPVFVHCRQGKDRTGTVVACYRISHNRWSNKEALDEARSLGLHRTERAMRRYILRFRLPSELSVGQ